MAGRGPLVGALALVLASVGLLLTAHAGPLDGAACGAAGAPTRLLQNDADLHRDASDDGAAPDLMHPTVAESYVWGWLDVAAARPGADLHDWLAVDLDGQGEHVMAGVVANYSLATYWPITLEAYAPGATSPSAVTDSNSPNVTLPGDIAGVWRFHLASPALADAGSCAPGASPAPLPGAPASDAQRNYGVYFGCNPFCVKTATG